MNNDDNKKKKMKNNAEEDFRQAEIGHNLNNKF